LPEHLKHILSYAAQACSADMSWKAANRYSQEYVKLQKDHNVKFYKTPDAILQQQLKIWDEMIAKRSAENPLFKKVLDSQRAFAERVGRWDGDTSVIFRMPYYHYFSRSNKA